MKAALGIWLGLALALAIVACGGTRKAAAPPTSSSTGADAMPEVVGGDPRTEIERLSADIEANLDRLQVPTPTPWSPQAAGAQELDTRPFTEIRAVCTPPARPSETCGDVCNLGTHICDNADRICTLAAELQPDAWATGKCEDGKKSCEASRRRCCDCV